MVMPLHSPWIKSSSTLLKVLKAMMMMINLLPRLKRYNSFVCFFRYVQVYVFWLCFLPCTISFSFLFWFDGLFTLRGFLGLSNSFCFESSLWFFLIAGWILWWSFIGTNLCGFGLFWLRVILCCSIMGTHVILCWFLFCFVGFAHFTISSAYCISWIITLLWNIVFICSSCHFGFPCL